MKLSQIWCRLFWTSLETLTKSCSQTQLWFSVRYRTPKAYIQPGFVKDPSPSAGKGVGRDPWDYTHLGRTGGWESGWLLLWRLVGSSWRRNGNGTPWKGNSRFGMIPIPRKQLCCHIVYGCWMRYTAQRLWTPANKIQDQLLPSTENRRISATNSMMTEVPLFPSFSYMGYLAEVVTPSIRPCWRSMLFWNKSKSNY